MAGIYESGFEQGEPDTPLAFRMMEDLPGFTASLGFAANRGSNTLLRGGFMDDKMALQDRRLSRFRAVKRNRASRYRIFQGSELSGLNARQYKLRGASKVATGGTQGGFMFRASRVNNATLRPRAISRFHSISVFGKDAQYTPFQGSRMIGKSKRVTEAFEKAGIKAGQGESLLGPGLFAFTAAGRKADLLEKKLIKHSVMSPGIRGSVVSPGVRRKLAKIDTNIARLASMNNPALMTEGVIGVGVRGNMMASSMSGGGSRYLAGYGRGALGKGGVAGLTGEASKGARAARYHMYQAIRSSGLAGAEGLGAKRAAMTMADEALEKGVFKTLGKEGVIKALGTKSGMKVLGMRAAAMAIPGLNVLATASLVYDLGKMAGEVVKSGINLAKDAAKSMQGDIAKPMFGMGYRDTEAAATSRSRGVMAIQNSQLNARSALGNEGAMMAAHFG